jgi:hypothetical protein
MNAPHVPFHEVKVGRRASPRLRLHVPAELVLTDGRERCLLDDISRTGAQVTVARTVFRGTDAVLRCGELECFGEIVWVHGNHCGLLFDRPLPHEMVLAMRSASHILAEAEADARQRAAREWVMGSAAKP